MSPPIVMRENFIKTSERLQSQKKLPTSLIAFLGVCQLSCGFNFGIAESLGKFKMAALFMMTAAGCIMIVTLFLSLTLDVIIWSPLYIIYFIQYVPFFAILLTSKYTLYDFLTDLIVKNEKSQAETKKDKLGMFLWLYTTLMLVAKIGTAIVYCLHTTCTNSKLLMIDIAVHIPMLALDIIPIANFIIFYKVYASLRDLRIKYEHCEMNLKQLSTSYKKVADVFDRFRLNYDAIIVWGFLTESGKWMVIIWKNLKLIKTSSSWWLYGCSYTWALSITVQICVPAVFAEMISVQTDAIKMNLHDKLLIETDEVKAKDLTLMLRYISARPLLRKAWRLVPMDLRLPVTMLSICITYLIVIIQFTHLFD